MAIFMDIPIPYISGDTTHLLSGARTPKYTGSIRSCQTFARQRTYLSAKGVAVFASDMRGWGYSHLDRRCSYNLILWLINY